MSSRFLWGMGLAFFLVFALGIGAVVGITAATERSSISDVSFPERPSKTLVISGAPSPSGVTFDSTMPDSVLKSDIVSLASAVKLGEPANAVGKDVWARELLLAQQLQAGMCDCDQRNWLKQFVETGREAIAGSSRYPQSFRLLGKLRRSNEDLAPAVVRM